MKCWSFGYSEWPLERAKHRRWRESVLAAVRASDSGLIDSLAARLVSASNIVFFQIGIQDVHVADNMITDEEISDLPEDPQLAFVEFEKICRARVQEKEQEITLLPPSHPLPPYPFSL